MKIAVGISGGVDSSVAAYLLKQEGHEVIGITMCLNDESMKNGNDSERVCESLEIPFYKFDLRKEYEDHITNYIRSDYLSGRTPNPCVKCNKEIKFGLFLDKALNSGLDFEKFATGHYAIIENIDGIYNLKKGLYTEKDQTYFLAMLTQSQLSKIVFPLGELTKWKVRHIAKKAKLFTYNKEESQDLCTGNYKQFFPNGDYSGNFIEKSTGKILGKHDGIFNYTIGQRRGLDIGVGYPIYVTEIDEKTNTIYVGKNNELFANTATLIDVNYMGLDNPKEGWSGVAKIRYRDSGSPVILQKIISQNEIVVNFPEGVRAITPGQLCVAYNGEYVAFSGVMKKDE